MLNLMQYLLICLLSMFSLQVLAGPFGLEQGMSLEQIKKITKLREIDRFAYEATTLPKGSDAIVLYNLIVTPAEGLCGIVVWTQDVPTSPNGKELRDEFDSYAKVLSEKYGPASEKYNFLHADSIWEGSKYWMRSLSDSERTLTHFWQTKKAKKLPDSISKITLNATVGAGGISTGRLLISYAFNNFFDECEKTIEVDSKNTKKEKLKNL